MQNKYDLNRKVIKVIESVANEKQAEVAEKYVRLYFKATKKEEYRELHYSVSSARKALIKKYPNILERVRRIK
jgi:hypothetical protein